MESLALCVEIIAVLLSLSGIAYGLIALWGARDFEHMERERKGNGFAPGVSILKPLKGVDARMYAGFVSHCTQTYKGEWEIVFGVTSMQDDAVAMVERLQAEHPLLAVRLVECPQRLGTNGKVSTLAQLVPHARYEYLVVNDSDIVVSMDYLQRVIEGFSPPQKQILRLHPNEQRTLAGDPASAQDDNKRRTGGVGLVTVPYIGRAEMTFWSRLEALGISTDFMPGVLTARKLEGGIRFGLGSTLATTKSALESIGGFASLVDQLADDYELGARLSVAGYRVELVREVVETTVPAYSLRGFCEHQLRWSRSTRDSRRAGYIGLGVTYVLPWALLAVVASGCSLWSLSLLSMALLVRVGVALTVGVGVLRDGQVLRDIWLLPLRDCFGLFFWAWSYASDVVVWRGEKFRLKRGCLERV
jgi:ceramide glucosyltransferase